MRALGNVLRYGAYCQRYRGYSLTGKWTTRNIKNLNKKLDAGKQRSLGPPQHPKSYHSCNNNISYNVVNKILTNSAITHNSSWFHTTCFRNDEKSKEQSNESLSSNSKRLFLKTRRRVLQLDEVVELLNLENMKDIVVIRIPDTMCYVDYFIIATAMSPRHLATVAELTNKLYKSKRKDGQPFTIIEGKRMCDDWQCIDFGDMVLHLMLQETREEYELEKLWVLGPHQDDLMQEKPSDEEVMRRLSMQGLNLMSMTDDMVAELNASFADMSPWDDDDDINEEDTYNDANLGEMGVTTGETSGKKDELEDDDAFLV